MLWKITRFVKEEYHVTAETEEEALMNIQDPYSVLVTKEWCEEVKGD